MLFLFCSHKSAKVQIQFTSPWSFPLSCQSRNLQHHTVNCDMSCKRLRCSNRPTHASCVYHKRWGKNLRQQVCFYLPLLVLLRIWTTFPQKLNSCCREDVSWQRSVYVCSFVLEQKEDLKVKRSDRNRVSMWRQSSQYLWFHIYLKRLQGYLDVISMCIYLCKLKDPTYFLYYSLSLTHANILTGRLG